MKKRLLTLGLSMLSWLTFNVMAQTVGFSSEALQSAAKKLQLARLDTLPEGISLQKYSDYDLVIRKKDNCIEHIGRHLFAFQVRKSNPSPVYDYLEYVLLDHLNKFSDNPFLYKNFLFEKGNWEDLALVNDSVPFSITKNNGKRYKVEWTLSDQKQVAVTFPIDYARLLMISRRELENNFIKDLLKYKPTHVDKQLPANSKLDLVDAIVWRLAGNHYMIKEINNDAFYCCTEQGDTVALWDKNYPELSMANLFNLGLLNRPGHGLVINFRLHENKQNQAAVTIEQLLAFCEEAGCHAYWGSEGISDNNINGTLMLVNESSGYNHIFAVSCPLESLFEERCAMTAVGSLFIPTQNIQNIFYQTEGKKKKIKIE